MKCTLLGERNTIYQYGLTGFSITPFKSTTTPTAILKISKVLQQQHRYFFRNTIAVMAGCWQVVHLVFSRPQYKNVL